MSLMLNPISEKMDVQQYSFKLVGLGDNGGDSIFGTMLTPLVLGGGNQFSTSGEMVREGMGGIMGKGGELMAKGRDLYNNKFMGRQMGGIGRLNQGETRNKWTTSTRPQVSCDCTFLANSAGESEFNAKKIQLIKSAVLPRAAGGALMAPLGYVGDANGKRGTLTFALGYWFVMNKMVMVSESCTASTQIMRTGYPHSWHVTFVLEPYEMITIQDFKRYFQLATVLDKNAVDATNTADQSASGIMQKNRTMAV